MRKFLATTELAATAHHIVTVQAKLDRLDMVKRDSWRQVLTALARTYQAGEMSVFDLEEFCAELKESYGAGFSRIWDESMPIKYNKLQQVVIRQRALLAQAATEAWHGHFPIHEQLAPEYGVSVVYVLFNAANEPVYTGSTGNFRSRMAGHRSTKPGLVRWSAYRCRDREHAYRVEDTALKQHMPPMNTRRGR